MITVFSFRGTAPLSKSWPFSVPSFIMCFSMAQLLFVGWQKWKSNRMVQRATLTHQTVSHLLSISVFWTGAGWWCAVGFHILSQQWERSQLPSSCLQLLRAKATALSEQVDGLENCIKTCRSSSSVHHAHVLNQISPVMDWHHFYGETGALQPGYCHMLKFNYLLGWKYGTLKVIFSWLHSSIFGLWAIVLDESWT